MPDFASGGPIRPEDIDFLLSGDGDPLAHRRPLDLPEMDDPTWDRPPFEFPRISVSPKPPGELPAHLRKLLDDILSDQPIAPKPQDGTI